MSRLAPISCALWTLLAAPVLAGISTPVSLGSNIAASATNITMSTTADSPAGQFRLVAILGASGVTVTDTAGNTYTVVTSAAWSGAYRLTIAYNGNPTTDLPGPCTLTATETSTTLVVTAVTTCSSTATFTSNMAISGGSFTGVMNGSCTLVAGAATCAITGGATVASPATATISSTIKAAWTGGTVGNAISAITVSGIAVASPLDVTGTLASGTGTSASVATGTLGQAAELVVGVLEYINTSGTFTEATPSWNTLSGPTPGSGSNIRWAYQVVNSTTGVTYNPSWGTSRAYGANVFTFKGSGGAAAPTCTLSLLGVGPC